MRILIVDDDPGIRMLISRLVVKAGHDALEASNGVEALRSLDREPVQMVVSDIEMPGLDGIALTRRIRERQWPHYIYIVLISVMDRDYVEEILAAGADDFICKPLKASHLRARLRGADRITRLEMQLQAATGKLAAQNEVMRADLKQAQTLQELLLPKGGRFQGLEFRPFWRPSAFVSGDCFNAIEVAPGIHGFFLIDVAGHGAGAGLMAATLLATLDASMFRRGLSADRPHSPALIAAEMNGACGNRDEQGYFTALIGIYDSHRNEVSLCSAGGMPALILGQGGCASFGDGGYPIGLLEEATYEDRLWHPNSGDLLFLISDGVTDSLSAGDPDTGLALMRSLVAASAAEDADLAGIVETIGNVLPGTCDGQDQLDDLTIVGFGFTPSVARAAGPAVASIGGASDGPTIHPCDAGRQTLYSEEAQ